MSDAAASLLGEAPPAPAPTPDPTPAPAPSGAPAGGETPPQDWDWGKHAKDDDLGWLQAKGYKAPADLVKAARSLESMVGLEKLPIPKDPNDTAAWDKVYNRLGRPEKAADYKLDLPENADKTFVERMTNTLHANGVSQKAAQAIVKEYMGYGSEQQQAQAKVTQADHTRALDDLKIEWGAALNQQVQVAQMGIDAFCGEGMLDKFKATFGPAETLKFFNKLGNELREAKQVNGDGGGFGPMTPAQAKYEIGQKRLDTVFMQAYMDGNHPGHAAAIAEMTRLQKFAAPE